MTTDLMRDTCFIIIVLKAADQLGNLAKLRNDIRTPVEFQLARLAWKLHLAALQYQQSIWVEHNHIFYASRQIELRPDLQVFCFIAFADNLDYGFWNKRDSFLLFFRFSTENGYVGPF